MKIPFTVDTPPIGPERRDYYRTLHYGSSWKKSVSIVLAVSLSLLLQVCSSSFLRATALSFFRLLSFARALSPSLSLARFPFRALSSHRGAPLLSPHASPFSPFHKSFSILSSLFPLE